MKDMKNRSSHLSSNTRTDQGIAHRVVVRNTITYDIRHSWSSLTI
jgi:hypothetical protein